MAEFDYEVVDGRKIRVRPQEVVSEIFTLIHMTRSAMYS